MDSVWTERRHPVEVHVGLKRWHRRCPCERRGGNRGSGKRKGSCDGLSIAAALQERSWGVRWFCGRLANIDAAAEAASADRNQREAKVQLDFAFDAELLSVR